MARVKASVQEQNLIELDVYRLITPHWLYFALLKEYEAKHEESPYDTAKRIHKAMKRT